MKTITKNLTPDQILWCRKSRWELSPPELREMVRDSGGTCKLSGVKMIFDAESGNPQRGGPGVHPLYASIDHIAPGNPAHGYQIVCYALNDLKGHLPYNCFKALMETSEWKSLMGKWKAQAKKNPDDREAFKHIVREKQTPEIPHL